MFMNTEPYDMQLLCTIGIIINEEQLMVIDTIVILDPPKKVSWKSVDNRECSPVNRHKLRKQTINMFLSSKEGAVLV